MQKKFAIFIFLICSGFFIYESIGLMDLSRDYDSKIRLACAYIETAQSSNNVDFMTAQLKESLNVLENFSGNADWYCTTNNPKFNFDLIKTNINMTILTLENTKNNDTAQQLCIANTRISLDSIKENLMLCSDFIPEKDAYKAWIFGISLAMMFIFIIASFNIQFDDDCCI